MGLGLKNPFEGAPSRWRWAYEAAGVPEYLIVDPDDEVAVLLRLEQGRYQEAQRVEWGTIVALLGGRVSIKVE